ncbi:SusC/RagA family TonB-linked outer membrane protein [Paraflavitalea pollutisoli]|uniref:SusC/RagA family TonB-linked outer membrane protein n=1 Tax=Paraflavitalea pollutisoli TaxID=3034143 RepID=UPI0023ECE4F3|nr:TonB-dependent receptor [Paraflavitalea sp. H1-2-19X]
MKNDSKGLFGFLSGPLSLMLSLLLGVAWLPGQAQNNGTPSSHIVVAGRVTDDRGNPFAGVSVNIKNTQEGTVTDANGRFSLNVPGERSVLVFSHVGFAPQERMPGTARNLNIEMKEEGVALGDVVVVAYGKQKKATVTGAVSTVSGKELVGTSVSNISNMLIGNAPGLSGLQTSGEPGRNGATIYIRGVSTFSGSINPLVVIDGVEQAPERAYDQLNAMDANEIENVSILKDASATAVYGIRGANGVIIVTSKRGRAGKAVLSVAGNYGFTKATKLLHNVNAYDYAIMRNEAIRTEQSAFNNTSFNNNLFSDDDLWKFQNNRDYTQAEIDAMTNLSAEQKQQLANAPALYYGSQDLFAQQFGNTGPQQQLNLNISGGTSKLKYFTSLGYFSQGSILNNTKYYGANTESKYNRYNFRSNFDIDVVKNLQVSVNLAGQFGETSGPGIGAGPYDLAGRYKIIMQYIFDSSPLTAPGLIDGKLVNSYAGVAGSPSNPLGIKLGSLKGAQNATRNLLASGSESLYNTLLTSSIVVRHNMGWLTPGLSARATINYDDNYVKAITTSPSLPEYSVRRNPANPNDMQFFGGARGAGVFNADPGHNSVWRKTYFDAGLDYNQSFGDHNVTGLVLAKAQKYSIPNTSDNTASGIMGLVGRVAYNYAERYLLEVNVGYNGTEQFLEGKRFGLFPAYSAGWVMSNEKFFPKGPVFSFLKLRASYGEVGNDQIGNRRYLYLPSTFNTGQAGYYWGSSNGSAVNPYYAGASEGNIGNPDVTWERAIKQNFGLEARFLQDRLALTVDVFRDKRNNILTNLSEIIPYAYGVSGSAVPPANVGKTTNQGYEIVLGWTDKRPTFSYFLTANLNYAKNKILYRAEAQKAHPWMAQTGYPIGQYRGLVFDGFFNTKEQLDNRPNNTYNGNKAVLGDVRYKDINADGLIDNRDNVPIGYSNLPQYTFSFKAGGSFKGFDLSMLFTGSAHGSFSLANYQFNMPFWQTAGNLLQWQYDGRWTPEKAAVGQTILYPRATMHGGAGGTANYLASDLWLVSSDFVRLKNIEIGYTLNKPALLNKVNVSAIRLYANANNLLTWGDSIDKGIDPESTDSGGYGLYPMTRVFVIGANIRF